MIAAVFIAGLVVWLLVGLFAWSLCVMAAKSESRP